MRDWRWRGRESVLSVGLLVIVAAGCGGSTKTVTVSQSAPAPQNRTVTVTETVTSQANTGGDGLTGPSVDTTPATTTDTQASGAKIADRRIGQVGGDGGMLFKVLTSTVVSSVAQSYDNPVGPVAGAKLELVTVDVKNNGKVSDSPFCGGGDTVLIDVKGRNFDSLSQVMVSMPGNNTCDDLQPGFRGTYKVLFQVPKDATISAVGFWDSSDTNDYDGSASWVRFNL